MSPGRKPSRSPASTAGRVRMMRPTSRSEQRADGQRHREVRLAGARGPDGERDRVVANRVHVAFLVDGLGGDLLATVSPDDVVEHLADVLCLLEGAEDGVDRSWPDLVDPPRRAPRALRRRSAPPALAALLPPGSGGCRAGGWSSRAAREASQGGRRPRRLPARRRRRWRLREQPGPPATRASRGRSGSRPSRRRGPPPAA